jgi:ABC-type multidrug transport system fused ATPase/permease subunit
VLLARLIYQDSDIYVIHNLFKEVTKTIAKSIFDSVIKEFLCCNTVIYSSNNEKLVKRADLVLVFHKGTLIQKGCYEKLIKEKESFFYRLIKKGNTTIHTSDEFKRMQ